MELHHNGQVAGAHDVRGDPETAGFVQCEEKAKPEGKEDRTINLLSQPPNR